jgi:hypothetical protein
MIKEDDATLGDLFSYVGDDRIILRIGAEHFVREEDFSSEEEVQIFRRESKPGIDAGMINKRWLPFEEMFHYSLTADGEKYYRYKSLQPAEKQSQSNREQ